MVEEFKEHHVETLAQLITKSFISMNKIWRHFDLPYDEVKCVIRGKILPTIGKLAFVICFIIKDHVRGWSGLCSRHADLND